MHSEGILAGEMKHGPLALVDEHMPMIVLATQDRTCNKMHSVVQQLRARGANPLVVCNVGDDQIAGVCEGGEGRLIRVSSALPALLSLLQSPTLLKSLQLTINVLSTCIVNCHFTVCLSLVLAQFAMHPSII